MTTLHPTLHALRGAFRTLAATYPDIGAFCGDELAKSHREIYFAPATLPVLTDLPPMRDRACPATQATVDAILAAAPHLAWRQSYTTDDPGFDAHYLRHYGWFDLVAPSGPFVSERLRLSVGYWGEGLHYPWHRHEPEEIYLTLAGETRYISEGRADLVGGPGATVPHQAWQYHAATMETAPLLAAAFWRGEGLEAKSTLIEPDQPLPL